MLLAVRHRGTKFLSRDYSVESLDLPPVLYSQQGSNVTALLGETVELRCTVLGFKPESHSVSWTRTTPTDHNPTALTFGDKVRRSTVSSERWYAFRCSYPPAGSLSTRNHWTPGSWDWRGWGWRIVGSIPVTSTRRRLLSNCL